MNICLLTDEQKGELKKRKCTDADRLELAIIANANMALIKTIYIAFTDRQTEADDNYLAGIANLLLLLAEPLTNFIEYGDIK